MTSPTIVQPSGSDLSSKWLLAGIGGLVVVLLLFAVMQGQAQPARALEDA